MVMKIMKTTLVIIMEIIIILILTDEDNTNIKNSESEVLNNLKKDFDFLGLRLKN